MEEVKIQELPEKESVQTSDYMIVDDEDGTKKVLAKHFRSLVLSSLYFSNIDELKNTPERRLRDGDICETLGYHEAGDGGAATYKIVYDPGAVEDGRFVHYLSYSDTLRAELVIGEKINVHQFGARGDGKTDDTDAIQAALNNAITRTIEFNHGRTYITKKPLNIINDNIVINGNGAYLYPHYVDGIVIKPESDPAAPVHDVTINNLNFNCYRATNAININRSKNIYINKSYFKDINTSAITIANTMFANIDNCDFISHKNGSISDIVINGDYEYNNNPECCVRPLNIRNCIFRDFNKAIHVLTTGVDVAEIVNSIINVLDCHFYSQVVGSCCVYLAAPIESMTLNSISVLNANTFLYFGGASKGNVSCKDISHLYGKRVFDVGTSEGILYLGGTFNTSKDMIVFEKMYGKLHSNIAWDFVKSDASFTDYPIGEMFDTIDPALYNDKNGYSISGGRLVLRKARNLHVDWSSSTSNLTQIDNGVKGQLLYIKSSTGKSIIATANRIVIGNSSIQLNAYTGILLKYDGLKWVQVTNGNSVINNYQTVNSKSTYDIWKEMGNTGTPQDFMNDISGKEISSIAARSSGSGIVFTFSFNDGTEKIVSTT